MQARNIACVVAAGFVGLGLTASATHAFARPNNVIVRAERVDPSLQRKVSYAGLNLAYSRDQRRLKGRIWVTASRLCLDLNGAGDTDECTFSAVHSTDSQVTAAIDRAERRTAGLPVGPAVAISMSISNH